MVKKFFKDLVRYTKAHPFEMAMLALSAMTAGAAIGFGESIAEVTSVNYEKLAKDLSELGNIVVKKD